MSASDTPSRENQPPSAGLVDWAEIGRFAEAISLARKELFAPVQDIRAHYQLGPRGIWIIGLIANGRVRVQSDIARLWHIGRSMVTEEISALNRAGLVTTRLDEADRRQVRIELTSRGHGVNHQLGQSFSELIEERLIGFNSDEINLCIRLLQALAGNSRSFRSE